MLVIKTDTTTATSQGGKSGPTEYLRATVIGTSIPKEVEALLQPEAMAAIKANVGKRGVIWSEAVEDIDALKNKILLVTADLRDNVQVKGSGVDSLNFANLSIEKTFEGSEESTWRAVAMAAASLHLQNRGAREVDGRREMAAAPTVAQAAGDAAEKAPVEAPVPAGEAQDEGF